MNFISTVLKPLRFLFLIFTCTLLIFSSVSPAFAASGSTTQEGQAAKVYTKKAQDALNDAPQSLKEVQKRTAGGLNEVQGKAGIDKMKRPSNSQNATTAQDYVERALDNAKTK